MAIDVVQQKREAFRAEALELLIELDSALLALESEPGDAALVHRVFHAIHTIKCSGATAGLAHLARFAQGMEEAFDMARDGRLPVTPELIDCGLKACEVIRLLIDAKTEGSAVLGEVEVAAAFTRLLPTAERSIASIELAAEQTTAAPDQELRIAYEIVFKPNREMFHSGADPVTLLNDLRQIGQAHITAHAEQVPAIDSIDPEHCYLWWEVLLITQSDEASIKDLFVFVEDDCELQIRLREDQAAVIALFGSVPADALALFRVECEDHLEGVERDALMLEKSPTSRDALDSLFRRIHSIKGNAGLLLGHISGETLVESHPLRLLLRVTHRVESLLDPFRKAQAGPVPEDAIQTALDASDAIRTLLGSLTHGNAIDRVSPKLLERLGITSAITAVRTVNSQEAAFLDTTVQCVELLGGCLRRLEEGSDDPGAILQQYRRGLKTWTAAAKHQKYQDLEHSLTQQLLLLDAVLKAGADFGSADRLLLSDGFWHACSILDRDRSVREASRYKVSPDVDSPPVQEAASAPQLAQTLADAAVSPSTIRIEQNKLDRLLRIVSELLVARGAFPLLAEKLNKDGNNTLFAEELKVAGSNISRIADELQASVMSIRMLPVKTVFQRFPRLVRDLARSLGKEVRLVIEGESIELDKTILEQLGDPLVHVVRNAVDHGLETPEQRLAAGKAAVGQLTLRAYHEAGGVVIAIIEDGRGIDASALKRKAVEKGLMTQEAAESLSEEAAFDLVFLPGLSTATKLTDVSGRGVGMDVVRSNVRNLHGTIKIRSKIGQGTTFLIWLPTSLMGSEDNLV